MDSLKDKVSPAEQVIDFLDNILGVSGTGDE